MTLNIEPIYQFGCCEGGRLIADLAANAVWWWVILIANSAVTDCLCLLVSLLSLTSCRQHWIGVWSRDIQDSFQWRIWSRLTSETLVQTLFCWCCWIVVFNGRTGFVEQYVPYCGIRPEQCSNRCFFHVSLRAVSLAFSSLFSTLIIWCRFSKIRWCARWIIPPWYEKLKPRTDVRLSWSTRGDILWK